MALFSYLLFWKEATAETKMPIFIASVFSLLFIGDICLGLGIDNSTNPVIALNRTEWHSQNQEPVNEELVEEKSLNSFCPTCVKPKTLVFGCIFLLIVFIPFAALFMVKKYYSMQNDEFPYKHCEDESGAGSDI